MEINEKKVWICLSMGFNGMSTGYFLSVVKDITQYVVGFMCAPGCRCTGGFDKGDVSRRISTNLSGTASCCLNSKR
jgi:hypothetical protein